MFRAIAYNLKQELANRGIGTPDREWDRIRPYDGPHIQDVLADLPSGEQFVLRRYDAASQAIVGALNAGPQLERQRFITDPLGSPEGRLRGIIQAGQDIPVRLRLRNFVHAADFVSWEEGRGAGSVKYDQGEQYDSQRLIKRYARMTSIAPPLGKVVAWVQPNGMTLFETLEGSHRTAAALRRGEQTIGTTLLYVTQASHNVIDLPQ